MGCDIHLFVEKQSKYNKRWISADIWTESDYSDDHGELEVDLDNRIYSDRNYDAFAILANVRNGYGFAGIDTGDGFVPIDDPRGLPDDISPLVRKEAEHWEGDGHSHSYFTLKELKEYNWTGQITKLRGVVNSEQYKQFKADGIPKAYCGGVSGPGMKNVSNQEMEQAIASMHTENVYTPVEWQETYASAAGNFYSKVIPKLEEMCKNDKLEEDQIRIVFWFDN